MTPRGLAGDRAYALIDATDGKVATAKNPRKWPTLFSFGAALADAPRSGNGLPAVRITLPDGTAVSSDQPDVDAAMSRALNREVRLQAAERGSTEVVESTFPNPWTGPDPWTAKAEEYWPDMAEFLGLPDGTAVQVHTRRLARRITHLSRLAWRRAEAVQRRPDPTGQRRPRLEPIAPGVAVSYEEVVLDRGANPATDRLLLLRAAAEAAERNLLLAPAFAESIAGALPAWRRVVSTAVQLGIPVPVFSASLAYYDGLRAPRLPAALIQAQRDYFGAHTYRRVDREGSFHTDWSGDRRELPA